MIGVRAVAEACTVVRKTPPFSTLWVAYSRVELPTPPTAKDHSTYEYSYIPGKTLVSGVQMSIHDMSRRFLNNSPIASVPAIYPAMKSVQVIMVVRRYVVYVWSVGLRIFCYRDRECP